MKRFSFLLIALFSIFTLQAQILEPVSWEFSSEYLGEDEFNIIHTATIDAGWHIYSQDIEDGGPVPTSFKFEENKRAEYVGKVVEKGEKIDKYDKYFDMDVSWYDNKVQFIQKVKLNKPRTTIKGELEFMVCDAEQCLPPEEVMFEHKLKIPKFGKDKKATGTDHSLKTNPTGVGTAVASSSNNIDLGINKSADILDPVKWRFRSVQVDDKTYDLFFDATIEDGWYVYSQDVADGGPIPTTFEFEENPNILFEEEKPVETSSYAKEGIDEIFKVYVKKYQKEVSFRTRVNVKGNETALKGVLEFQTCDHEKCLAPTDIEYSFPLTGAGGTGEELVPDKGRIIDPDDSEYIISTVDVDNPVNDCGNGTSSKEEKESKGLWYFLILGIGGGLIALVTPCVFPMIPLTVSFFTKGSKDRRKGIMNAVIYGLFIFIIYVAFSLPFHLLESVDGNIFNQISTNVYLNIFFFVIFVIFGFSFLGFFEIQMPTWVTNKADSASNTGGLIGIFFMAITLALVSFSCTGPILGSLLAGALSSDGGAMQLSAGMGGFGLALGVPFAFFAFFPGLLASMKSGGWMDSVKKFLGFVELALAIKFLSNADLVKQWGLLPREIFFGLWIIIGILLAMWLFGKLKLPHDSFGKIGGVRLTTALLTLAFIIYLIPGLTNTKYANLKLLSGFPPPLFYSLYEKKSKCPLDLDCRKDYQIGLAKAKAENKPIFVDFTGWACVNCRKMEENVWVNPEVFKRLNEDFVVVSLYVDDDRKLEAGMEHNYKTSYGKVKKIDEIGEKWAMLQHETFKNNSQPWYAILSPDEILLNAPVGYTPNPNEYKDFLDCGLAAFEQLEAQDNTTSL